MNSVIFLDFRKASDIVNHEVLLNKLSCYGVGDEELLFLASYLKNRTQCCSVHGYQSTLNKVISGVLQGSILVSDAIITMYADDTSLDKAIRTAQQLKEELQ